MFTDSPFELVQAEGQHRDHAIVEQVFADVTSGPLAHMPSGVFAANAAWLSIAAMAHNLLRAAGALASLPFAKARAATIRRDLIAVAARTARHGRGHLTLHLPEGWHREHEWLNLLGRGLRAARRSGLTSPEPVRTPTAPRPPRTPPPSQEPRTSRTAGERQDARARNHLGKLLVQESSRKRATGIGRWIEAKSQASTAASGITPVTDVPLLRRGHSGLAASIDCITLYFPLPASLFRSRTLRSCPAGRVVAAGGRDWARADGDRRVHHGTPMVRTDSPCLLTTRRFTTPRPSI